MKVVLFKSYHFSYKSGFSAASVAGYIHYRRLLQKWTLIYIQKCLGNGFIRIWTSPVLDLLAFISKAQNYWLIFPPSDLSACVMVIGYLWFSLLFQAFLVSIQRCPHFMAHTHTHTHTYIYIYIYIYIYVCVCVCICV